MPNTAIKSALVFLVGSICSCLGADDEPATTTGDDLHLGSAPPDSFDWRAKGKVTPVKNQGQCGSSWAFAATGALEGASAIKTGALPNLSEQQLVDCSASAGNQGCEAGSPTQSFTWLASHGGSASEASYPYTARDGVCRTVTSVAKVSGSRAIAMDDASLRAAVAVQPVAVEIRGDDATFVSWHSGIYPCIAGAPNTWVLIVGYGTDAASGKHYWLAKNSMGTAWGESGYVRLQRGDGCRQMSGAVQPIAL